MSNSKISKQQRHLTITITYTNWCQQREMVHIFNHCQEKKKEKKKRKGKKKKILQRS
jgi:hypothetical protein